MEKGLEWRLYLSRASSETNLLFLGVRGRYLLHRSRRFHSMMRLYLATWLVLLPLWSLLFPDRQQSRKVMVDSYVLQHILFSVSSEHFFTGQRTYRRCKFFPFQDVLVEISFSNSCVTCKNHLPYNNITWPRPFPSMNPVFHESIKSSPIMPISISRSLCSKTTRFIACLSSSTGYTYFISKITGHG